MNIYRRISILIFSFCLSSILFAQEEGPHAEPVISFLDKEKQEFVELKPGDSQSTNAPCDITCTANMVYDSDEYDQVFYEWKIYKTEEGESKPLVDRFDENTTYTLTESGGYSIKFIPTFINTETNDTIADLEYVFSIVISESKLTCTDFISPNDDDKNDVLVFEYQSLVKVEGYILNRWGKKLHTITLDNIGQGWDGKVNGKPVKDGAYLLYIDAVGSDGLHYKIKKAINVLKGAREDADSSTDS